MEIYTDIDSFLELHSNSTMKVGVFEDQVLFPFEYSFVEGSEKLIFFLPGAFNRALPMPKFQRSSYFKKLKYNCISFFDPTLFLTNDKAFTRAWFQGTIHKPYVALLLNIIKKIIVNKDVSPSNILFFATSSGGIPAIQLAAFFPGCHVFCGNIQTNLIKHYPNYMKKVSEVCFEKASLIELKEKFSDRLNITHIDEDIFLHLIQNRKDEFHLKNHFLPYLDSVKKLKKIKFESIVYVDEKSGHNPLPMEMEIEIIENILDNKTIHNCFNGFEIDYYKNNDFNLSV